MGRSCRGRFWDQVRCCYWNVVTCGHSYNVKYVKVPVQYTYMVRSILCNHNTKQIFPDFLDLKYGSAIEESSSIDHLNYDILYQHERELWVIKINQLYTYVYGIRSILLQRKQCSSIWWTCRVHCADRCDEHDISAFSRLASPYSNIVNANFTKKAWKRAINCL